MSSLTRCRADPKTAVPNDLHVEYYSQRASAGMILSECSQVVPESLAFPGSAGIFSDDTVKGWRRVNDAVHAKGGLIFLQIWHGGRAVPFEYSGVQPIAPSPLLLRGMFAPNRPHTVAPREMNRDDFKYVRNAFRKGAENAKRAGFDGLQLHGAHGYLIDSFIRSCTNKRTDEYGGSVANRCRFPLEILDQLIEVFGPERVGMKVSPNGRYNDMIDDNPVETYSYLLKELDKRGCSFIEIRDADEESGKKQMPNIYRDLRPHFKGAIIVNERLSFDEADKLVSSGLGDLASWGRAYIANPDLVERYRLRAPLNEPDPNTFYGATSKGYTDYPFLSSSSK
eukprot:TRINITY_DN13198_c0_g1_i2.p1 TRINITY_DN13198_c0_g1~~TRINITY_DN13198_c0_g1_i2.p1  ORF type:complete len:339 (-),score=107.46 TRINITY_DN13198_c0_g1_i2:153-1169(-)